MTGRRLYDLVCDGWALSGSYTRGSEFNTLLPKAPLAWPFLSDQERRAFSHAAARATPKRKTS